MSHIAKSHFERDDIHDGVRTVEPHAGKDGRSGWHCVTRFDSWDAYVRHVETRTGERNSSAKEDEYYREFTQTDSLETALTLAHEGWAEKRDSALELKTQVLAELVKDGIINEEYSLKVDTKHDYSGSFVDIGAYMTGDPECMVSFVETEVPASGKVVKIHVDGCYSGGTNTDTVIQRGAVCVALCEILDGLGFSVEVVTEITHADDYSYGQGLGNLWSTLTTIKNAESPMNLDTLMFALAHPSTLRRLNFRAMEGEGYEFRKAFGVPGGYGYPRSLACAAEVQATVSLEAANRNRPETLEPAKWIRDIVKQLFGKTDEGEMV